MSSGSPVTWRHMPVVAEWEAAKLSGRLVPHVCLQLKLGRPIRPGPCPCSGIAIVAQLDVARIPSAGLAAPYPLSAVPADMAAERRAVARRAAEGSYEAAAARAAAQAAIASVPWAVRFALKACEASEVRRPDAELLARHAEGRALLTELAEARGQAAINHITARHRLPRLRVPSVDGHSGWIYAVVVGPSASATASSPGWAITRYEGPFRRR